MLQRSKLNNIFDEYQSKINRENFNINIVKEVLEKIKNNLNDAESKSDSRFKLYGRMLILKEQLDNNLNNKNYVDAYFNIKDFLDQSRNSLNDKPDIIDSNIEYYKEDIICSEEKESLIEMIDKYLKDLPTNEIELNNNGVSDFDREMMKKFNIDSNINNIKDLSKAINEKKKEMLINGSKEQAKKICESIGEDINNFDVDVFENIDAVLYTPNYQQRGISGFAIADDGTYEIFGSIHALRTYIKEFEEKYKSNLEKYVKNFISENDNKDSVISDEYHKMFEQDENGAFINLIIPSDEKNDKPLDLRGKLPDNLTLDEIIRMKKYSQEMHDKISSKNISIPDSLKDYISFDEDGYVFANQKLPSELENDYNNFINNYYMGNNKVVNNVMNKIKELPYDVETTIAQLIKYNPEIAFVSPMTQGIIKGAVSEQCRKNNIKIEENRNELGGLPYYVKFKKIDNSSYINTDESLKLSNGKYANNIETKETFENYMDEVNHYNEQVANGEKPDITQGDLLNKYQETFYDESLENKISKINEENANKEKGTKIDDLINKIDEKIKDYEKPEILTCPTCNNNLMFMEPDGTTLYCKNCNKYFKNNNGSVGDETVSPYTDPNALY